MSESLLPGRTPSEITEAGTQIFTDKPPEPTIHETSPCEPLVAHGAVPPEECARIITDFAPEEWLTSRINGGVEGGKVDEDVRASKHVMIPFSDKSGELHHNLFAMVQQANLQHFAFDINYFDGIQLTRYDEGDFYNWHADTGPKTMGNRKLSITIQLTDPAEYEGGEVQLAWGTPNYIADRGIGSATIFPSFLRHRVLPVTKGTRYSLVVWVSGNRRFR